jgi:hypothetical protein
LEWERIKSQVIGAALCDLPTIFSKIKIISEILSELKSRMKAFYPLPRPFRLPLICDLLQPSCWLGFVFLALTQNPRNCPEIKQRPGWVQVDAKLTAKIWLKRNASEK